MREVKKVRVLSSLTTFSSHPPLASFSSVFKGKLQREVIQSKASEMDFDMEDVEAAAQNCSLRLEHVEALNLSQNLEQLMRLYNMCEHTWDPDKTWGIYFWEELIPPLVVYM